MKNLNVLFCILCLTSFGASLSHAQIILYDQAVYGGSSSDHLRDAQQTIDGGFILAGGSYSNDGDVSGSHGPDDSWIVKLDKDFNLQWQNALGGSDREEALGIKQAPDGSYYIASISYSDDGDVSENHGDGDFWVTRLNSNGDLVWEKSYGGSDLEYASDIVLTTDGGFILAGRSRSNDGDVSGIHGIADAWIVKCDVNGDIQWEKSLGGTSFDAAYAIKPTSDGGYIFIGSTYSNDGDVSGHHGDADVWVVKLNSTGDILWQKALGGTLPDHGRDISQTGDDGYIVVASAISNDGDVTGNHGSSDYWVLKLDASGNILWKNCYGGSQGDVPWGVTLTGDGGFLITGQAASADGDIVGNQGDNDVWTVKLDAAGVIEWGKTLGGSEWDYGRKVFQTGDREYAVIGGSASNDGDVILDRGFQDYWSIKLVECPFIECGDDLIVNNDPGICGAAVIFPAPTPVVGCSSVSTVQTAGPESGGLFPSGTTTVSFLATDATGNTASCSFTVTVISDLTADAGSDQAVIIDNGPGPDPYPCDTLEASASTGTPPYTYSWSPATGLSDPNAATTDVCPTVTTTYTLTVTDAIGCESTDEVTVTVVDIDDTGSLPLVGNNPNKVYVCHLATCTTVEANVQANCNSPHSLCAHLSHGDVLGECTCKNGSGEGDPHVHDWTSQLKAYPNPFTNSTTLTFTVKQDCRVTLSVFDITGKEVARLFDGAATGEKLHVATLDGSRLGSGIYFYSLQTGYGESFTRKLVLSR